MCDLSLMSHLKTVESMHSGVTLNIWMWNNNVDSPAMMLTNWHQNNIIEYFSARCAVYFKRSQWKYLKGNWILCNGPCSVISTVASKSRQSMDGMGHNSREYNFLSKNCTVIASGPVSSCVQMPFHKRVYIHVQFNMGKYMYYCIVNDVVCNG